MSKEEALEAYKFFLKDIDLFNECMRRVSEEWKYSCENFLTNTSINRVAWLGQAAMCIYTGIPSCFRGGFKRLSPREQSRANSAAEHFLFVWEKKHERNNQFLHKDMEGSLLHRRHTGRSADAINDKSFSPLLQSDMFSYFEE